MVSKLFVYLYELQCCESMHNYFIIFHISCIFHYNIQNYTQSCIIINCRQLLLCFTMNCAIVKLLLCMKTYWSSDHCTFTHVTHKWSHDSQMLHYIHEVHRHQGTHRRWSLELSAVAEHTWDTQHACIQ